MTTFIPTPTLTVPIQQLLPLFHMNIAINSILVFLFLFFYIVLLRTSCFLFTILYLSSLSFESSNFIVCDCILTSYLSVVKILVVFDDWISVLLDEKDDNKFDLFCDYECMNDEIRLT